MEQRKPENLDQTWIIDLDGTIVKHRTNIDLDKWIEQYGPEESWKQEEILDGVSQFFDDLSAHDKIVFMTAREERHREHTCNMLKNFGIPYSDIIFSANAGPRIIMNDIKPKERCGLDYDLKTAHAVNLRRNEGLKNVPLSFV